jgi:hypothetical protein
MAMANAVPMTLGTEPLFYGSARDSAGQPQQLSAEDFLERMDGIKFNTGMADPAGIKRCSCNFRDNALAWWRNYVRSKYCTLDIHMLENDWLYFCVAFKRRWFVVSEINDTVCDIGDLKQRSGEPSAQFLERLVNVLHPLQTFSDAHTQTALEALDVQPSIAPALANFILTLPVVDPPHGGLSAAELEAAITATIRHAHTVGALVAATHNGYDHVVRTAARNCKMPQMAAFLRKKMFEAEKNMTQLMTWVHKEERSYFQFVDIATEKNQKKVSEVEFVNPFELDGPSVEDLDAMRGGGRGRGNRRGGGRGGDRGGGRGGQRGGGAAGGGATTDINKGCPVCNSQSHTLDVCRKMKKFFETKGISVSQPQGQQQQQHPRGAPTNRFSFPRGRGGARGGQRGGRDQPMDTSVLHGGGADQQEQQQQHQQQAQEDYSQPNYDEYAAHHIVSNTFGGTFKDANSFGSGF